jgi:hypothetical protein
VAGYAASARLQGAAPVFAFSGGNMHRGLAHGSVAVFTSTGGDVAIDQLELIGRPIDEAISDWLASIGESFSQLTFFLFDPESWR